MKDEEKAYKENPGFWTRKGDEFTLIGDFLGRAPSIELISPKPGDIILDAGCGAGFFSRKLAKAGAKVYGCDRSEEMLAQAILQEKENPLGIEYKLSDITDLPYRPQTFDKIACIAVLIHDSPEECSTFFREARITLKDEGKLVLSLMHPDIYLPDSPNRTGNATWAQYSPLDNLPLDVSQRFSEVYRNARGETFTSTVWYHPEKVLTDLLEEHNLSVISTHHQYVTRDALNKSKHVGGIGYPGFLQIVAQKK